MHGNRLLTRFLFALLCVILVASEAIAQSATPSASASSSADLKRVSERIKQVVRENKDEGSRFIGVVGTLSKVGTSTFTLTDVRGLDRTVQVSPTTTILLNGKTAALADLAISSGVVVMGSAQDELVIDARRILVQDKPFTETRQTYVGSIQKWDGKMIQLSQRGSDTVQAWNVAKNFA